MTRACGLVALCQRDPVLVLERIGKFLEIAEQVILPEEGSVDRYAGKCNALYCIHNRADARADLLGNLCDREPATNPRFAEICPKTLERTFDRVGLGCKELISTHAKCL